MAQHSSKTLLPEPFTGSNDFESYATHFKLLSQFQKWQRKETVNGAETEIDERPHYFALRLQNSAIDFYRTLSEDNEKSYDKTVKAFRQHYNEKPVVFRGRLARRVQQPGEKLKNCLGDLQTLALKAYPQESTEIREHLILRGFLEGIENSQVQLDLKKNFGDADMILDRALERPLHIEAVTRIEEEDNEPRFSAIQSKENSQLLYSINDFVRTLQTNHSNRQENQKFCFRKERGQKSFCAVVSEVQEKTEIKKEVLIVIPEAALSIEEPITEVELVRQNREVRTEAEIDRTRIVRAVEGSGEFRERKMLPLRSAKPCI